MTDKHLIHKWAKLLQDEPVTMEEAQLFTLISANDRLTEMLGALQDMQSRLTRLELYLAAHLPDYEPTAKRMLISGHDNH